MILDEILVHKRSEVDAARIHRPLSGLKALCADAAPARDFVGALKNPNGRIGLISEIKKASPSAGIISPNFDPVAMARRYEHAGADCLSVLTDARFFQGRIEDMQAARTAVKLPVLRKDFVVDSYQLYEARAAGADCVLLIVAALSPAQVSELHGLARELGLAVLVEAHSEEEMTVALASGATLVGINSRDLRTFVTDLGVVERVAKSAPPHVTLVAESGVKTRADVDRLLAAGARAILVGETLMRTGDVGACVRELTDATIG
ncbi:MAG: indole-3-glycerol phosphate synthase TrpC [Capsulimonadaceae bacterium]|nr:indole-3-glycerol phosphate synthase TrpC [Capsulimonadaceae bacterium]